MDAQFIRLSGGWIVNVDQIAAICAGSPGTIWLTVTREERPATVPISQPEFDRLLQMLGPRVTDLTRNRGEGDAGVGPGGKR